MSRMKQLSNGFVYSLLPIGGSVLISYPCSRPHVAFWNSPWSPSPLIRPVLGYMVTSIGYTNRDVIPTVVRLDVSSCREGAFDRLLVLTIHYRGERARRNRYFSLSVNWVTRASTQVCAWPQTNRCWLAVCDKCCKPNKFYRHLKETQY